MCSDAVDLALLDQSMLKIFDNLLSQILPHIAS